MIKHKYWWLPYTIAIIALCIGTFFDYAIDAYLYDPANMMGIIFERYILCFFIAGLTFVFTMLRRLHKRVLYLIPEVISALYAVIEVSKYIFNIYDHWVFVILSAIALFALSNIIVYRINEGRLRQIEKKGIFYACVLITAIAITFILKNLWGRVRFRELQDIVEYTAWYLPQGMNGHSSFPSGHMTTFSAILSLLVISKRCEKQQTPLITIVVVYASILCMGLSRMIMGAHYLSDVAVAFMITYSVYLAYKHYFYKKRYL